MAAPDVRLSASGVSYGVNPDNPNHLRALAILTLVSGVFLALGVTLCSLHANEVLKVPCSIRHWVLAPVNTISSSLFTMSFIGLIVSLASRSGAAAPAPAPAAGK